MINGYFSPYLTKQLVILIACLHLFHSLFKGYTPLHAAAKGGHTEVYEIIMASNLENHNPESNNGDTPLHFAAKHGHYNITKLILENLKSGFNPNNSRCKTPLHFAAESGHHHIYKLISDKLSERDPVTVKGRDKYFSNNSKYVSN